MGGRAWHRECWAGQLPGLGSLIQRAGRGLAHACPEGEGKVHTGEHPRLQTPPEFSVDVSKLHSSDSTP